MKYTCWHKQERNIRRPGCNGWSIALNVISRMRRVNKKAYEKAQFNKLFE